MALKQVPFLLLFCLGLSYRADAQAVDDYRSRDSGNWNASSTWQRWNGSSWTNTPPTPTRDDGAITVRDPHEITVDSNRDVDQLTIEFGAKVTTAERLRIVNGPGVDLQVDGTLQTGTSNLVLQTGTSNVFSSTSILDIPRKTVRARGNSVTTFETGAQIDIGSSGRFSAEQTSTVHFESGTTLTNDNNFRLRDSGRVNFSGTFIHKDNFQQQDTSQLIFLAGSIFEFDRDGGTFPTPSLTSFEAGSSVLVTGVTSTIPTSLNHDFHHFEWNATGQTTDIILAAAPVSFGGDFTVTTTGSGSDALVWIEDGSSDMSISGDFIQTSGIFELVRSSGSPTMYASDISVSGGTLNLNAGSGSPILEMTGDLSVLGSLINSATVSFVGLSNQSISSSTELVFNDLIADLPGMTLTFDTDLRILSSAVCRANSTIDVNGKSFTFAHDATLYNAGTVAGDITMERLYNQSSDGWRMIAAPVSGVNYSDLNGTFETQGAAWASTTIGATSLESLNFGLQDWTALDGADASFSLTEGYIFYMFSDDEVGNPVLPATWTITGSLGKVNSKPLAWNTSALDSYNYFGNPTATNLDWDAVVSASTNLSTSYATWDPFLTTEGGLTGYKYYNSASGIGLAGRYIPPFTAFMAQPTASGGTIQFPTSEAANTASANHFGKKSTSEYGEREISSHIQLQIEGQGLAELETYLVFDDRASDSEDDFDVNRMKPFSSEYVTINLLSNERLLAFDGRNVNADIIRFDLEIVGSTPGLYQISWPVFHNIPESWSVYIIDHREGRAFDMRLESKFAVQLVPENSGSMPDKAVTTPFSTAPRFSVFIDRTVGANASEHFEIGSAVTLTQNFPNPFSGSTTFRFSVPQPTHVSLELFDLLGRKIELIHSGPLDSGWHSIGWDTSSLASRTLH